MTRVLVTGATRGLGLAIATELAAAGLDVLVSGRDRGAVDRVARAVAGTAVLLDLADPVAVARTAAGLPPVDVVVANAGVSFPGAPTFTAAGLEETFAVNVLGHVVLAETLLSRPVAPTQVVLLGSITHDPSVPSGMPKPDEGLDVAAMLRGSIAHGGRRYTTSKLHLTALSGAWSRSFPRTHWTTFDPGLMPGTGLARARSGLDALVWTVMGRALAVLPVTSTPARSAAAVRGLVVDTPFPNGSVADFLLRPGRRSRRAADPAYQDALLEEYRRGVQASAGPSGPAT